MDPISATASIITLVDVAVKTYKLINGLIQGYRNAPVEIEDLKHELHGLHLQHLLLQRVQGALGSNELGFSSAELTYIQQFLQNTSSTFSEIYLFLDKKSTRHGKLARLKWAAHDSSKVKAWESRLRGCYLILQSEIKQTKDSPTLPQAQQQSMSLRRFSWAQYTFASQYLLPHVANYQGSISCIKDGKDVIYGISIRLHAIFWLKVFCLDFTFKHVSLLSVEVPIPGMMIKNIVPESSEIMRACKSGDITAVCGLFLAKKASVHDITPENFSPLSFAIQSGSVELISFLINNGADPMRSFGRFQTAPLYWAFAHRQIAAARFLMSKGADVHHIRAGGMMPAFSLFGPHPFQQAPCEEYLQFLSATPCVDFDDQDGQGWTALHRAAAYGTVDQIRSLISRNASPDMLTTKLLWSPIFCAVRYNKNILAFKELAIHQPNFLTATDMRNWTLLHLAVDCERLEIVQLLLRLGADPLARASPTQTQFFVSGELKGLSVTPGDIAKVRGDPVLTVYLDALVSSGHEIEVVHDTEEDSVDMFWPALEQLEEANKIEKLEERLLEVA